jgi:hypothetical protein
MRIRHVKDHARARKEAYPDIGDQLDAIWTALSGQKNLPADTKEMFDKVMAVKAKFPKPQK